MKVVPLATIDHAESPHFVYRFYNASGELLYVGYTNSLSRRWSGHGRGKAWWVDVAYKSFDVYNTGEEALIAEAVQIRDLRPKHNVSAGQVSSWGWAMGSELMGNIETFMEKIWKGNLALARWKALAETYRADAQRAEARANELMEVIQNGTDAYQQVLQALDSHASRLKEQAA